MMATFVDSELAGAAGFAGTINAAPGLRERIAAARIVTGKLEHAALVLDIMGSFGADVSRYASHHPWTERIARGADIGTARTGGDMRLSVFQYPLQGWTDAVVMNVLMGKAVAVQLGELVRVSYQPLAEAFRTVAAGEALHTGLGIAGLRRIVETGDGKAAARDAIAYWQPRVAASFGVMGSERYDTLRRFGLRHRPNEALLADWRRATFETLAGLGLA
jgi:1,2-phenylacetyl-CoA epoxidase catalytic subunit